MNEHIETLEQQYQKLLSDKEFQNNFNDLFNIFLNYHPKPYQGLKRKIIFQHQQITLYHYQKLNFKQTINIKQKLKSSPPLLIIYAFINRPSILDLQEDRSFIKKLLENNLDVYLLDWGNPTLEDKFKSLKDYIDIINIIFNKIKSPKINLLGICQGGTLSLCYASLYPKKINKLITMVTPVDFKESVLSGLLKNINTEKLIQYYENIPGQLLSLGLQSLKPFRILKLNSIKSDFFFRMEKWIKDCPDHPGLAFHEFISEFYQKNNLIRGQFFIGNQRIDLSKIKNPILNVYSEQDHLIPAESAKALKDYVGSLEYQEISFSGGHIGVFVSQKALESIPAKIHTFLK
jgi:polyhydroxyalkanoate synthase